MGWLEMGPGLWREPSSSQVCLSLVRGSLSRVHPLPAAGRGRSQYTASSSCQTWMLLAGLCWAGIEQTTHGCFHKVPKANTGYAVADWSGLQIKSQETLFPVRDQILTTHCLECLWRTIGCLLFRSHLGRMSNLPKAEKKYSAWKT